MADVTVKIITPADSFDLMTLEELKESMQITDTTQDAALQEMITRYSDVVSVMCNRVFGKETVRETWRCVGSDCPGTRLFLSHWPVKEEDVTLVAAPIGVPLDPAAYELEERSGKLTLFGNAQTEIVVTYTGGFILPDEAPPALKQACEVLIRTGKSEQQRQATSGIRSLSHKEARVMFFDPAASQSKQTSSTSSGFNPAVQSLLMSYVRLQV